MQLNTIPKNDKERLLAVKSYKLNRCQKDISFNNITALATTITNMPVSLISIVDKDEVWFKSAKGMQINSSEKELSFCSYAIASDDDVYIVENTKKDLRFVNHPYTKNGDKSIAFYAGVCLTDKDNHKLGTLCVIDHKPNAINKDQKEALKLLAQQVVKLIELNKSNLNLKQTKKKLTKKIKC